ncbi:peptide chain release factor N(5)-glutamine methyltransferase [bacterium]|nr:peptide chain release factor N(5)-glutamine methyltransferase [bacterium]
MNTTEIWTPPKLVQWISNDFSRRGFPPPHRLEAEQLVSFALSISRLDLYLQYDRPCTKEEQTRLRKLVERRHTREPLAYILQECDFWSMTLEVGPGVLIPRQDTEVLIEAALEIIPNTINDQSFSILELGTGSGAIPLALCSERDNLFVVTIENSEKALQFAIRNIDKYKQENQRKRNKIFPVLGNGFDFISKQPIVDLMISNPPYIPAKDIEHLQEEVALWEPKTALNGGEKGLDFYELLKSSAEIHLKTGGFLIFEHGYDQKLPIIDLMKTSESLTLEKAIKDYSKQDRVLVYQKK